MGVTRNGARTFLNLLRKICQLSHLPGFQTGIVTILGDDLGGSLLGLWNPLCALVDTMIASDDFFNRKDNTGPSDLGGEDTSIS